MGFRPPHAAPLIYVWPWGCRRPRRCLVGPETVRTVTPSRAPFWPFWPLCIDVGSRLSGTLKPVEIALEAPIPTLPRGANIGCSRACWASFRWQQATSRPYYDQTWAPTPPIAPARCHEACRSHGGDPRAPLQHFNRKTARKWPRTWHRPAHRPLDANQGWHMRWGRQQAADDARCAHEA